MVRKILILAEISLILVLSLYLNREVLQNSAFGDWEEQVFGSPILGKTLLLFVLPLPSLILTRRNPGAFGLTNNNLRKHARLALHAIQVVLPATALIAVIALMGTDFRQWLGSFILTLGFATAGVVMLRYTRRLENISEAKISLYGFWAYGGMVIAGVGLVYLLQPISELIARIIIAIIFIGFLEEFFFRGYLLTRLNDVFGRPYSLYNVNYGAGLIVGAVIFGLFHPLSITNELPLPWAWALWVTMTALIFGFLREKSGAVVTPALVHGALTLPAIFFAGG